MASDLPDKFDVIVLGTGLPETLLAAAFSRIGLTVLHLDRNNYYCGTWASLSLRQVPPWVGEQKKSVCYSSELSEEKVSALLEAGEKALRLPETFQVVHEPQCKYHVGERPKEDPVTAEPPVSSPPSKDTDSSIATADSASPKDTNETEVTASGSQSDQSEKTAEESTSSTAEGSEERAKEECSGDIVHGQFDSVPDQDDVKGQEVEGGGGGGGETQSPLPPDAAVEEKRPEWFSDDVEKQWRKFSFDLAPKVLYCSGSMVELLIVSDVAKYCEFRTVSRVLTMRDGKLEKVPCSRADVFSSKALSLIEKRLLMKFLKFAVEYNKQPDEYKDYVDKPFVEFLASKKLSPKIQHFILYSIAMATEFTMTEEGLKSTQKFLHSLGRYGNTAFLFPLYGSGELPQGYCRLSAVFGGIYVLTLSVSHLLMSEENKCTGVITSAGQRITCKYLIADPSYLPEQFYNIPENRSISRGIYVTDRSIFNDEDEHLSLLQLPHQGQRSSPTTSVMELPPSAMVSPRPLYVVHMTRASVIDALSDLQPAVSALFIQEEETEDDQEADTRPKVLWSLVYQQRDLSCLTKGDTTPHNVFVTTGPGVELDMDGKVEEARAIFKEICPDEEFLPKPPHPDDIIYVDTEEVSAAGNEQSEWSADTKDAATTDSPAEGSAATGDGGGGEGEGVKESKGGDSEAKHGEGDDGVEGKLASVDEKSVDAEKDDASGGETVTAES